MAEYQLTATDVVLRKADQAWIPNDPGNRDRIAYDAWVADGGVPDPATFHAEPLTLGPTISERLGVK